jgi:GT2 family glycosyltransferase
VDDPSGARISPNCDFAHLLDLAGCEMSRSIVAICTKDRPALLARVLNSIAGDRPDAGVLVVDASGDDRSRDVCTAAMASHAKLEVSHYRAARPGLARQRNEVSSLCRNRSVDIVHFLDDDAIIYPGYFDAIEACFDGNPSIGGVGGSVQHPPPELHATFNRVFLLSGRQPYTVARSGRVVNPHTLPDGSRTVHRPGGREVQWLQGFAMSYRMEVLNQMHFNEQLRGYSYGEDRDFSFRVGRRWGLAVAEGAKCEHRRAESPRLEPERFGFESTVLIYAWMSEWRVAAGFSRVAFFWSTLGDILRHVGAAAVKQSAISGGAPLPYARGVIRGIRAILRGGDLYAVAAQP